MQTLGEAKKQELCSMNTRFLSGLIYRDLAAAEIFVMESVH